MPFFTLFEDILTLLAVIAYPPRFEVQITPLLNPPPQSMNAITATLAAKFHDGKLK